jgi:serine/threonine protein kinase/tetratricopeptide (TPR) repeat protein
VIGKTISHYRILGKLGEGGMGVVYKAEDLKLDRFVAIKILPPLMGAHREATVRFIHEAKAASALDHPNIGTIYEIDEMADGGTFLVMAYYEGETLRSRIERSDITIEEAVRIVSQVASGLSKAHEKGIVHRDIKPSNIIITKDGQAKIVDFGLAKLEGRTRITRTGSSLGTVAYMSPEQARGEEVDGRSDIFSLGIVFYELLTGHLPFKGEHEAALLYEIVHEEPVPLAAYRQNIPDEIRAIIGVALGKTPEARFQSVSEMLERLERYTETSTVKRAISDGIIADSGARRSRSWKPWFIPIGIIAVVVCLFLVVRTWRPNTVISPEKSAIAVMDFSNLSSSADSVLSLSITSLINVSLVENSPIRIVSSEYLYELRRRLFGGTNGLVASGQALEVARKSGATILLCGEITKVGDRQYFMWRLVDTRTGRDLAAHRETGDNLALVADQIAAAVVQRIANPAREETPRPAKAVATLTTDSPLAYQRYLEGVRASDGGNRETAIKQFEGALELDSAFALAYFRLSREEFLYEEKLSRKYAEEAWIRRERLSIKDRMRLEGWRETINGNVANELAIYREMLARWPDDRESYEDLADRLFLDWYTGEAIAVCREGLVYYPENPKLYQIYWRSLGWSSHPEKAIELALSFARQHPHVKDAINEEDLGAWYLAVGEPDSAEAAFRRALKAEPDSYYSRLRIATCAYCRGALEDAIASLERLLELHGLSPGQRLSIITRNSFWPSLAQLYAYDGRYEKALDLFDEAKREYIATGSYSEVQFRFDLNRLLLSMDRPQDVLKWALQVEPRAQGKSERFSAIYHRAKALAALDAQRDTVRALVDRLRPAEEIWGGFVASWVLMIDAETAVHEKNPEEALQLLREMDQHTVDHGGWDDIDKRLTIARACRMLGRTAEAARVLHELLRIHGGYALAHYELGQVDQEMGRTTEARQEYSRFLEMWSHADDGLPQLIDARRRLAAL